jgi:hypothetical protein
MASLGTCSARRPLSSIKASLLHSPDECPRDLMDVRIGSSIIRVDEAFSHCADLMSSSCLGPIAGIHAFKHLAMRRNPISLLTTEITDGFAECIVSHPDSELFKIFKSLTIPASLSQCDVPALFEYPFCALLLFFDRVRQKHEDRPGWHNNITATKNAIRCITNLILAHPPFYEIAFSSGTVSHIFQLIDVLENCLSDEILETQIQGQTQAQCHTIYNQNNYFLASVAGMLSFYEAVLEFTVPDRMTSDFLSCLNFGSQYLRNYALKVIEKITVARPDLCFHFSKIEFLDQFFRLAALDRCQIDLMFVLQSDEYFLKQGTMSAAILQAKRRELHTGYHSLGILANFCRTHDPELTAILIDRGILDYDLMGHAQDSDLVRQFFVICKHILLTPACRNACLGHHCLGVIFEEWENWNIECRQKLNLVMARLFVDFSEVTVTQLFMRNLVFLELFVENIASARNDEHREPLLKALLKLVYALDRNDPLVAFLIEHQDALEEIHSETKEVRDLNDELQRKLNQFTHE